MFPVDQNTSAQSLKSAFPMFNRTLIPTKPSGGSLRSSGVQKKKRRHVSRACVTCRKGHHACNENRPCSRCVARGQSHLCKDEEEEKEGKRPYVTEADAVEQPYSRDVHQPPYRHLQIQDLQFQQTQFQQPHRMMTNRIYRKPGTTPVFAQSTASTSQFPVMQFPQRKHNGTPSVMGVQFGKTFDLDRVHAGSGLPGIRSRSNTTSPSSSTGSNISGYLNLDSPDTGDFLAFDGNMSFHPEMFQSPQIPYPAPNPNEDEPLPPVRNTELMSIKAYFAKARISPEFSNCAEEMIHVEASSVQFVSGLSSMSEPPTPDSTITFAKQQALSQIMKDMNEPVMIVAMGMKVIAANQAACQLVGLSQEEIHHEDFRFFDILHPLDMLKLVQLGFNNYMNPNSKEFRIATRLKARSQGRHIECVVTQTVWRDPMGVPMFCHMSFTRFDDLLCERLVYPDRM